MKNLTKEKALALHHQMWSDMQRDLGDNPDFDARVDYKVEWCDRYLYEHEDEAEDDDACVHNYCFLCEYAGHDCDYHECECLIKWPAGRCEDDEDDINNWSAMPISKLLALPEREEEE